METCFGCWVAEAEAGQSVSWASLVIFCIMQQTIGAGLVCGFEGVVEGPSVPDRFGGGGGG